MGQRKKTAVNTGAAISVEARPIGRLLNGGYWVGVAAKSVMRISGLAPIEHKLPPIGNPKVSQYRVSLAPRVLGWEPKVSFDEGIDETRAYFRDFIAIPS